MTAATSPARVLFDDKAFDPTRLLQVTHNLVSHPLLQLDALKALARRLPNKQVRFHATTATAKSNFEHAPEEHRHHLGFDEAVDNMESSGSWIALHNAQTDPAYRALLDEALEDVRLRIETKDPGMFNRAMWIFMQSPNSVTPYHIDHENNFLMQIRGRKIARLWHPEDCLTDHALEVFHSEFHRKEVHYEDSYEKTAKVYTLEPGQGAYMPATAPHLVSNTDNVAITVSMTYCTAATRRIETINRGNHLLRRFGVTPPPVGQKRMRDALVYGMFRSYYDARSTLRGQPRDIPEWARH